MSRYYVQSKTNPKHTIIYGYDRQMGETYIQVITSEPEEDNHDRTADVVLALSNHFSLTPHPNNLTKRQYTNDELLDVIEEYGGEVLPEHQLAFELRFEF